ncbi:universal stress protein [Stieleria varia]|uniref:Universal stress protein family protein n=1 Tax=Stieleria varia TaxID=2528005 RepID=A0A5C6ANC6_9BACT|nr:universal stress protein [Stieleria varia]TWU00921.1 hypothetical protein Pla52n_42910 [Stieleria varia]
MSDSESSGDLDREVDASMRMFLKSQVGPAAELTPIKPSRVMLVLDGSTQDAGGIAAAQFLREAFNVETLVLDAREVPEGESPDPETTEDSSELCASVAAQISGARPIRVEPGQSFEMILAALQQHSVDLVVVPCPFGRSFDNVGVDSAGTTIDVLLARCDRNMLVIRDPQQSLSECVRDVSVVVGAECDAETRAAAIAFGLASEHATVSLNLVIEKEQYENIRSILEALSPEAKFDERQFSDALTKTHQALHGAMAKTATATGRTYALRPLAGEVAPPNPLSETNRMLLVLPLEVDDRFNQGFVHDRIRRSPHPVLVVPSHVEST